MKFALLIAAVAAIRVTDNNQGPNTKDDWSHTYTTRLDGDHQKVTDASDREIAQREAVLKEQTDKDAWRAKFDDRYAQ